MTASTPGIQFGDHVYPAAFARPLTLERVARTMDATIFGVPVGVLGEDGDQGYVCITQDRRRAIAAACAFYRTEGNGRARQVDVKDVEWAHVFDHCGCGPHEVEDGDHSGCDCDHPRLPPCSLNTWWWTWETVTADAVDAIPMIRIEVID